MTQKKEEMNKLASVDFFQLAKKEQHPRARVRLLALGHCRLGKKKKEISQMFQISIISLRNWVVRFLKNGVEGLKEGHRSGRKSKLPDNQNEEFRQTVEELQEKREGGRVRAVDIQVLLKEKFSVDYAIPGIYHLLKRVGLSWISVRSKHPKTDLLLQEEFKKKLKKK